MEKKLIINNSKKKNMYKYKNTRSHKVSLSFTHTRSSILPTQVSRCSYEHHRHHSMQYKEFLDTTIYPHSPVTSHMSLVSNYRNITHPSTSCHVHWRRWRHVRSPQGWIAATWSTWTCRFPGSQGAIGCKAVCSCGSAGCRAEKRQVIRCDSSTTQRRLCNRIFTWSFGTDGPSLLFLTIESENSLKMVLVSPQSSWKQIFFFFFSEELSPQFSGWLPLALTTWVDLGPDIGKCVSRIVSCVNCVSCAVMHHLLSV